MPPTEITPTGPARERVLVLDPIDAHALALLDQRYDLTVRHSPAPDDLLGLIAETDAVILRSGVRLPGEVLESARKLRVIVRAGSGTDNIDLDTARARGIGVFNVSGGSAAAVAELTIGLILALTRKIAYADRRLRAGSWDKPSLTGVELGGKTIGIVGQGHIGSALVRLAHGFSMNVVAAVSKTSEQRRERLAADGVRLVDFAELLEVSDIVVLALPLTPATRHLLGAEQLRRMRSSAVLVNVSRGGVVDEAALHAALRAGDIAGAALDVLTAEGQRPALADLDNVVLTPHIGAMTAESQRRIGQIVVDTLTTALAGGEPENRVW
ncbi:hydroxyacid dehydrogenase [Nocardia takedensis]|uniref:hydroxyacid dehydrogenase n=1 Tax=Nocardia takedensis TaxID=259390 RepID=UPI0002E6FE3E|nr:hydroxyacid dehydrogenase [Nocardia takedensis]